MTLHLIPAGSASPTLRGSPLSHRMWLLTARVRDWITTAADNYAAATVYEQLSRLSDSELRRRGLSRANLARDVCQAYGAAARL